MVFPLITACSEEQIDENKTLINIEDSTENTQFDKYLEQIYVEPFNIEYNYRLKDSDKDMQFTLVPADVEKSVMMANLIKYMCLDAYQKVAPPNFLKKYFPKKITVVGSGGFDDNNNMVAGTAEGGLEITLYNINNLQTTDIPLLFRDYLSTIYHEFSHILHQTVDYPQTFKSITSQDYLGGSWPSSCKNSEIEALKKGYVSCYSRKDFNEDFVEIIAYYVTYKDKQWNELLERAQTDGADGNVKILEKLEIVKKYMSDAWNINLDELRNEILTRADNLKNIDLTKID